MKIKLNLIVLILTFSTVSFGANFPVDTEKIGHSRADVNPDDYILPNSILPSKYDLTITPDLSEKLTIEGVVIITVQVTEETDKIILHRGKTIEFTAEQVEVSQTQTPAVTFKVDDKIDYESDSNFCTMTLDNKLKVGEATIKITYSGKIGEDNEGFYLAKYIDETGEEKRFGTTQFESTSARKAFPCFDQPDMKAKFTIKIIRPKEYNSVSNMRLKSSEPVDPDNEDLIMDTFEETSVNMPTYLIAFVVSELAPTGDIEVDKYNVFGLPNLIADGRGKYGVDNGKAIIEKMEEFLEVDYSLDKLDQVAIPDDYFAAGAMENWGLVTYKQRYLLVKDGVTTASEKQNVLSIIAHEFAHQWFGNLVTPKWWNSIWLSEGFATYFEHYATELVDASMKMMDQFITLTNQLALESDASDATRSMNADVYTPNDISSFFDRIAYQKAGAVIRMMEHIVTPDIFKMGLKLYLEQNQQSDGTTGTGSVEPKNLWKGIQDAVDTLSADDQKALGLDERNIETIMGTWADNVGYPVVDVTRDDEGLISLKQDRFLYSKLVSGEDTIWSIPINYATEETTDFSDTTTQFWFELAESKETNINVPVDKWFILNKQQTGFYRVNYDEDTWNQIIDYLNSENYNKIHVLNRAQLIDDSFNLARSGRITYEIPLRLSRYLTQETEYIPLVTFLKSVSFLNNYLIATENYDYFKTFVLEALQKAYKTLTVAEPSGSKHIDKLNRAQVISWMCRFEDENCTKEVSEKLLELAATTESTKAIESASPDLQNPYYCGGMRNTIETATKFKYLFERYHNENVEYLERARVLSGLGCSLDETHLQHLLNIAIGKSSEDYKDYKLNDNDIQSAFSAVYTSSDLGLKTALQFVADNFEDVKKVFPGENGQKQLQSIINGIASRTSSLEHSKILATITDEDYTTIVAKAVETITTNNKWAEEKLKDVNTWLSDSYGSAGFVTISVTLLFSMLVVLNVF